MQTTIKTNFPVEIIRTNRKKTASIKVEAGKVQLIIPKTLSKQKLEQLLQDKSAWIQEKLRLQAEQTPLKPKEYVSGESFAYLGKYYRLKLIPAQQNEPLKLKQGQFLLGIQSGHSPKKQDAYIKEQLQHWYLSHATTRLQEKTQRYAKIIGLEVKSITVKSYKARWGSCSAQGDISYNWKIIMAPHRIVDYVVVHELCHILHHDHSPAFWQAVARYLPDYKTCREWLKINPHYFLI